MKTSLAGAEVRRAWVATPRALRYEIAALLPVVMTVLFRLSLDLPLVPRALDLLYFRPPSDVARLSDDALAGLQFLLFLVYVLLWLKGWRLYAGQPRKDGDSAMVRAAVRLLIILNALPFCIGAAKSIGMVIAKAIR